MMLPTSLPLKNSAKRLLLSVGRKQRERPFPWAQNKSQVNRIQITRLEQLTRLGKCVRRWNCVCACTHTHPQHCGPRLPQVQHHGLLFLPSTVLIKQMSDTTSPLVWNQPFTPAYCAKCVWEQDYISRKALFVTLCSQVNPLLLFNIGEYFL